MRLAHVFLVIFVMAIWGCSFVAIKEGLIDMPPLLLCCLRFFFTTFPAIFFIKKPETSWTIIILYGLFMFALMFSLTFFSLDAGVTPGLASLLAQLQVFFTILLSVIVFKEHLHKWQVIGAIISFTGLFVVGINIGGDVTMLGLILIIAAAFSWGIANIISKKAGKINMLALIVWGSLFAWPPLLLASFLYNGSAKTINELRHVSFGTMIAIFYMAYPATILGFSVWGWMLSRYRAATIAPFALLIPFFGMLSSILIFNESLQLWKLLAALLIIGGLCINLLGSQLSKILRYKVSCR